MSNENQQQAESGWCLWNGWSQVGRIHEEVGTGNQDFWRAVLVDDLTLVVAVVDGHGEDGADIARLVGMSMVESVAAAVPSGGNVNDETSHDALTAWMTALVAAAVDGAAEAVAAAAAGESSGATAAVAIFRALSLEDNAPMAVGLANVGDCNALVLSSAEGVANEVVDLSLPMHRLSNGDERKRLEAVATALGGDRLTLDDPYLILNTGDENDLYIGITRAFGDREMSDAQLGHRPSPVSLRVFRPPEVGLVLLASDGLWDVPSAVDGQLAARLSECIADGTPSASAVTAAVRSAVDACGADVGTSDDTTVVAVVLRGGVVTAETTAV